LFLESPESEVDGRTEADEAGSELRCSLSRECCWAFISYGRYTSPREALTRRPMFSHDALSKFYRRLELLYFCTPHMINISRQRRLSS